METWEIKPTEDIRSKDGTTHPAPRSNSDFKEVKKPSGYHTEQILNDKAVQANADLFARDG